MCSIQGLTEVNDERNRLQMTHLSHLCYVFFFFSLFMETCVESSEFHTLCVKVLCMEMGIWGAKSQRVPEKNGVAPTI